MISLLLDSTLRSIRSFAIHLELSKVKLERGRRLQQDFLPKLRKSTVDDNSNAIEAKKSLINFQSLAILYLINIHMDAQFNLEILSPRLWRVSTIQREHAG